MVTENDSRDQAAVALGTRGGKAKSDRKAAAARANLHKARQSRWPDKETRKAIAIAKYYGVT